MKDKLCCAIEYGLELFKYHAEQRLKCIRYYLVLLTASVGAVGVFYSKEAPNHLLIIIFLCLISGITFFFWLLDPRNRALTEYAEEGLKTVEKKAFDAKEMWLIENFNDKERERAWHYGNLFKLFFIFVIALTVVASCFIIYFANNINCYYSIVLFVIGCCRENHFKNNKKAKSL